ncbi:MAG TPA: hypothetical protein PK466_14700, partial [Thermotogota bacterium]|nr:hypothetical protein [Thermotogota bacterium]
MSNKRAPYTNEHIESQLTAAEVLTTLGYQELTPDEALAMRGSFNNVLLESVLESQLETINRIESYGKVRPVPEGTI